MIVLITIEATENVGVKNPICDHHPFRPDIKEYHTGMIQRVTLSDMPSILVYTRARVRVRVRVRVRIVF